MAPFKSVFYKSYAFIVCNEILCNDDDSKMVNYKATV